jgi:hypothetical protein
MPRRLRLRSVLIAVQVATASVLLIVSAARSAWIR